MTLFERYRRLIHYFAANNRHGTHSPFAYTFVESVLNASAGLDCSAIRLPGHCKLSQEALQLVAGMVQVYGCAASLRMLSERMDQESFRPVIYVYTAGQTFLKPREEDIIIMPGIMESKEAFIHWKQLRSRADVPLSIETNVMGLLFFRKEFLRKQHFRLKRG